jgi:hypothetical protein
MRLSSSAPFTPPPATQVVNNNTQRSRTAPLLGWLSWVSTRSAQQEARTDSRTLRALRTFFQAVRNKLKP